MKKERNQKTNLQGTWNSLVGKVSDFPERIRVAIKEGEEEAEAKALSLTCLKNGTVDFDLIEEDIKRIHQDLENKGSTVLGSHLILDDRHDSMELQTYTKKEGKTYRRINNAKVQKLKNVPKEVEAELNKNKKVELSFTID